jgi:hypothetical protein
MKSYINKVALPCLDYYENSYFLQSKKPEYEYLIVLYLLLAGLPEITTNSQFHRKDRKHCLVNSESKMVSLSGNICDKV